MRTSTTACARFAAARASTAAGNTSASGTGRHHETAVTRPNTRQARWLRTLTVLAAGTLASAASANGPELDLAKVPTGLVAVYERNDGHIYSHLYVGPGQYGYEIHVYSGDLERGPNSRVFLDPNGNTVRVLVADGRQAVYQPHNCRRTLGYCRYTITDERGTLQRESNLKRSRRGFCREVIFEVDGQLYEDNTWYRFGTFGVETQEQATDEFCRPYRDGRRSERLIRSYVRAE